MKHCPDMSVPPPRPHWKIARVMALALFLLVPSLLGGAAAAVPHTGALRYPAITIYVGSG